MMQNVFIIDTIELLEVIANPIRIEIIDLLRFKAYSPMKLSKRMNVSPQKLNYHFKLLHGCGLIYKKYEEKKRGAYESFYQPIAHVFQIDEALFNEDVTLFIENFSFIDSIKKNMAEKLNTFPKDYTATGRFFNSKKELIDYIKSCEDKDLFHLAEFSSN